MRIVRREVLKIGNFFPTIHDITAAQDTTLVEWGLFRKHHMAWKDVYLNISWRFDSAFITNGAKNELFLERS
jgi:hypothetical protein